MKVRRSGSAARARSLRGRAARSVEAHPRPRPLNRFLSHWLHAVQNHVRIVLAGVALLTFFFGHYAATHLRFNVDPNSFFSEDLRFQRAIRDFERHFPVLTNSFLVVVDGETPELTRAASELLVEDLDAQRDVFYRAFQPGEDRFFAKYGLLYGSVEELDEFADRMATLQPVLGKLARDPTLPVLASVIQIGLEQDDAATDGIEGWEAVLEHLWDAADSVRLGAGGALSWETVLLAGSGLEPMTRSVVVADPILDVDVVLAAERPLEAARESVLRLHLTPENGVTVRITGYPAINHDEMIGLLNDTSTAGALSFVLVMVVLAAAFRSARLVLAAAITLLVGLIWAAAFAALAVTELNPLSISCGVLIIGLGIDFMIHLGMHFADHVAEGLDAWPALERAVNDVGSPLVLCAATTSVGFLAFVPTEFIGVSELGLTAFGGIVAMLLLTITLMPALIGLLMTPAACKNLARRGPARALRLPRPRPGVVIGAALVLFLVSLALIPQVDLDTNVISFRNQRNESVKTFKDLLTARETTPWYLDALVPSLDQADELAVRMRDLPEVDRVLTLSDFVPEEQEEKLEILQDVSLTLGLPRSIERHRASPEAQLAALKTLRDFLATDPVGRDTRLSRSVEHLRRALSQFIDAVEREGRPQSVALLADLILDPLPAQLERLSQNLEVTAISRDDLPATLVSRMLSPDGHARIQVYPRGDLWNHSVMVTFVESIRPIWGEITGLPVNLVESARATWSSLREALAWATLAITLLLLALWRSPSRIALVLGPLALAVLLTQAATVVLPLSFNFVNVVVLPLLIGIGVDSGIHLVEQADDSGTTSALLLESTTARAVLFSALTTIASFGTLMICGHRGVASLGALLVVGMIFTLAANLILLPALLSLREGRKTRSG